jgi:D-beta-D-heptose 7-phosphate kinase/D-beta-D-heptose 1-phosphate adenosyltransferase
MKSSDMIKLLKAFHRARILVVGDVMLDRFVYGSVDRISPEAPIPVLAVDRSSDMPGGAANVARNIAAMGAQCVLLGIAGADQAGEDLRVQLAEIPFISARLVVDPTRPTTLKTRFVADGQQVMRADREKCAWVSHEVEQEVREAFCSALPEIQVVVLSDYAKGVLSDELTRAMIALANGAGKPVIVDPKSQNFGKYRGATLLTPNRVELQKACGADCSTDAGIEEASQRLIGDGICASMVVTRGREGMSVVTKDAPANHLPTSARQVFDVSGAGDTVVACIALGMACAAGIDESATLANLAAGIVVGKRGTATVTSGELVAALTPIESASTSPKLFTLDSVSQLVRRWHAEGLSVAFANGCFDLLHPGHIALLDQARRNADRLIVGLNSDLSIRRLKGPRRPVQGEVARATVLSAVKSVDAVVIFNEDTPMELIEALEPDVLVKGADYTLNRVIGADLVRARGGRVVLADLVAGHSTTETFNRVAGQVMQ